MYNNKFKNLILKIYTCNTNNNIKHYYIVHKHKTKHIKKVNCYLQQTYNKLYYSKINTNTTYKKMFSSNFIQYVFNTNNAKFIANTLNKLTNMFYVYNNKQQTVLNAYKYYLNTLNNTNACLNIQQRTIYKVLCNLF